MQHWVALFTVTSWQEAISRNKIYVGFNKNQKNLALKIEKGDILIAYLTKVSKFVAVLRVIEEASLFDDQIWSEGAFPARVAVEVLDQLPPDQAVPVSALIGKLSFLNTEDDYRSARWSIHMRSSPRRWSEKDATAVWHAIKNPRLTPHNNSVSANKLNTKRKARTYKGKNLIKPVTVRSRSLELGNINSSRNILSTSKVTGHAVNFPIYKTCKPTEVCKKTCYFAVGLNTTTAALSHQMQNYQDCVNDPINFAKKVIREYDNNGLSFLRWNGGGDLFEEALTAIEHIGTNRPDIVLWIVSRIPELASKLSHFPNHFIYISLDRSTFGRKEEIEKLFNHPNQFFSYQVHPEEKLNAKKVSEAALIFMHDYGKIPEDYMEYRHKFCPLNGSTNIDNTCEKCRRCFR
jgi:hypothetical protein